jgi:quercetin dioxygenase-like cupin family protein
MSEPTQTETDEFSGTGIVGGEECHIARGDFVRIPAGIPHWISKIDGTEIIYLNLQAPDAINLKSESPALPRRDA